MNTPSIRDKERDRDRRMAREGLTLKQASFAAGLDGAGVDYRASDKPKKKK